ITTDPNAMNTSGRFQGGGSRPSVNGNREQTNNFMLDGTDVNDSIDNRIGYQPNVDALEEVKIVTGNGSSEWGNAGGAIVNMTIKSGTNDFKGNAFWFLRNNQLDANGFFRNRNNLPRLPFKRNIGGGTLGGPIRKNVMFFFMDYEGTWQRTSGPASASVAPAAWRTGDLSDFLVKLNQQIRDPLTGPTLATRTPFPNNQIPQSRFSPVARTLYSSPALYPLPNQTGVGALGVSGNYVSGTASKLDNNQADIKWDYRPTDKDGIMARFSIGRYSSLGSRNPLPVQMTSGTNGPTHSAVTSWTRTFSPTLVSEARLSFSRVRIDDLTVDWSGQLGSDGNARFGIPGGQPIPGLSSVAVGGGLTGIGSGGVISNTADNKYQFFENLTYQTGRHLIKMGGSIMRMQQNRYYSGNNGVLGLFRHDGTYSGVDHGDFLLNALASKGRGAVAGMWGHRSWRNALFVQDDWKLTKTFTVNLGMRWEYTSPLVEVADRMVNLDVFTGQVKYAGKDGNSRALYDPYYKQFMPRIGFAWNPMNRMVIRAGYALSSFMEGTGANLRMPLNPPFFVESDFAYDPRVPGDIRVGFSDIVTQNVTLDMPRPPGVTAPQLQARAWQEKLRPQFTQQWNFTTEFQVTSTLSMTAGYVGQKGTQLVAPVEGNEPFAGTGPFTTWANLNDRRPLRFTNPNVSNVPYTSSPSTMDYHSLQVSARKRFSSGLEFLSAYTWSKSLTDNLGYYGGGATAGEGAYWQNPRDRRGNRGPAFFDARHNLTFGGSYDLPVGQKRQFGSGMNKALDMVVGGWNIGYMMAMRSGFPVTILNGVNNTGRGVRGNIRPNYYRPLSIQGAQTVDNWFGTGQTFCAAGVDNGTCAYGQPANGEFGSGGTGTERAPGFFNLDFSIGKKFAVTERNYLEFRAEMFNGLNHVNWSVPGRSITSPATFGLITSQVGNARNIQFGLKYFF
ncbi:MAG: TonB-dependent receptor, partial [Bryobacter sp.]|nr:TonB-dependent receptor [Bryobacter sp.]